MHQIASDLNKAKREPFFDVVIADWDHRDCPTGDKLQKDIFGWLSPPDPWKNHHVARESCHPGTAEWFIQDNKFSEWRTSEVPSSLLWVHGKRLLIPAFTVQQRLTFLFGFAAGAGKSVFWCAKILYFHLSKTYCVRQLQNHRRDPFHAES